MTNPTNPPCEKCGVELPDCDCAATASTSTLARVVAEDYCAHCGRKKGADAVSLWCGVECLRAASEKQRREYIRARAIAAERHFEECDGDDGCDERPIYDEDGGFL